MAMVDRYKKSGGFVQLLQVIETCGSKKREQFLKIIHEETPKWAEAIEQKMITYDKILSWSPEILLEISAQVNPLAFVAALKSLPVDDLKKFIDKMGLIEGRKIESKCAEINPAPNEVAASVAKVLTETRALFSSGVLKYDKVDQNLYIPENIEDLLSKDIALVSKNSIYTNSTSPSHKNTVSKTDNTVVTSGGKIGQMLDPQKVSGGTNISNLPQPGVAWESGAVIVESPITQHSSQSEVDQLRKKVVELNAQIQSLKKENTILKEKLDQIKKIA